MSPARETAIVVLSLIIGGALGWLARSAWSWWRP